METVTVIKEKKEKNRRKNESSPWRQALKKDKKEIRWRS